MSNIVGTYPIENKPLGYRQLSISNTALALSSATGGIPKRASRAHIWVETDAIRWRDDGTAPTATVGMLVDDTQSFDLVSAESIAAFKAIRVTTDAKLNIAYYGSY